MKNVREFIKITEWLHHWGWRIPPMLDHLFMSDHVEEILITTDPKGLNLDESSQVGDIEWFRVIELGKKKIVVAEGWDHWDFVSYKKATAIIVRYHDAEDIETFINEKHCFDLKI